MSKNHYWPDYDWSTGDMRLGIEQEQHKTEAERFILHFNIPPNVDHGPWMQMASRICDALNKRPAHDR